MSLFDVRAVPLDLDEVLGSISADDAGGIDVFIGVVRNHSDGRTVTLLEYEAYPEMAIVQMKKIADGIAQEIPGVRLSAIHRVGSLQVGDRAIICAASAPHRDEAFRACRLLIDRIKADVPVWKREHGPDGPYWVGWEDARCTGKHGEHPAASGHGHHHSHD